MRQIEVFSEGINNLTVRVTDLFGLWGPGICALMPPVLQSMLKDDLFQTSPPGGATLEIQEAGV